MVWIIWKAAVDEAKWVRVRAMVEGRGIASVSGGGVEEWGVVIVDALAVVENCFRTTASSKSCLVKLLIPVTPDRSSFKIS